jgi:hypothetical protein
MPRDGAIIFCDLMGNWYADLLKVFADRRPA